MKDRRPLHRSRRAVLAGGHPDRRARARGQLGRAAAQRRRVAALTDGPLPRRPGPGRPAGHVRSASPPTEPSPPSSHCVSSSGSPRRGPAAADNHDGARRRAGRRVPAGHRRRGGAVAAVAGRWAARRRRVLLTARRREEHLMRRNTPTPPSFRPDPGPARARVVLGVGSVTTGAYWTEDASVTGITLVVRRARPEAQRPGQHHRLHLVEHLEHGSRPVGRRCDHGEQRRRRPVHLHRDVERHQPRHQEPRAAR